MFELYETINLLKAENQQLQDELAQSQKLVDSQNELIDCSHLRPLYEALHLEQKSSTIEEAILDLLIAIQQKNDEIVALQQLSSYTTSNQAHTEAQQDKQSIENLTMQELMKAESQIEISQVSAVQDAQKTRDEEKVKMLQRQNALQEDLIKKMLKLMNLESIQQAYELFESSEEQSEQQNAEQDEAQDE